MTIEVLQLGTDTELYCDVYILYIRQDADPQLSDGSKGCIEHVWSCGLVKIDRLSLFSVSIKSLYWQYIFLESYIDHDSG